MSKLIGAGIAVLVSVAIVAGGLYIFNMVPQTQPGIIATLPIECTGSDKWAGGAVATTGDLYFYRMNDMNAWYQVEKVDLDSGADDTTNEYTTGEALKLRYTDPTDTSYADWYADYTVPFATQANIEAGEFELTVFGINMDDANNDGTADWDPYMQWHNGTAIAASATLDVTNNSLNTEKAYIDLYILNDDDDTGYFSSFNFIDNVWNNAYLYMSFSGTGWDAIVCTSVPGAQYYERNNYLWVAIPLADLDLTRDVTLDSGLNPLANGLWSVSCTYDFTGEESGDSVTWAYGIKFDADWDNFVSTGNWGPDCTTIAESVTLSY